MEAILARVEPAQLSELYKLGPEGFDPNMENDFLMRLADRRGRRAVSEALETICFFDIRILC